MGKKIAIGVLFALLLGGAFWQSAYIDGATGRLSQLLEAVRQAAEKDDMTQALRAADTFRQAWNEEKRLYEALIDHEDLDLISAAAERMRSYCATRYRQGALAETQALLFYVRHLRDVDSIRWENIF